MKKCPSIAVLWPSSAPLLPSHQITTSLSLPSPPSSILTGSSDGSIILWSLHPPIHPLSVLFGHSSPITSLAFISSSDLLLSASSDGVLCLWSPPSLRCLLLRCIPHSPLRLLPSSSPSSRHPIIVAWCHDNAILILDSSSLTVIRTLDAPLPDVKSVVLAGKDAVLVDGHGKIRFLNLEKDEDEPPSSLVDDDGEEDEVVEAAVSEDGKLLALIYENRCVFKLVANGFQVGVVGCEDGMGNTQIGGVFLKDELEGKFVVWRGNGSAMVYSILSLDDEDELRIERLCEIPAVEGVVGDERLSIRFCQFKSCLVRSESVNCVLGDSNLWESYATMWSIPLDGKVDSSILLGEGGFKSRQHGECTKNSAGIVSASMVLSEDSYAPYAIIYGFYNGDIEVVRFVNLFLDLGSTPRSQEHQRFFSGHTGAVLCLAARCIASNSTSQRVCRVLISGSTDCTVRIWDLDSGNVISILHHHIAPVKQIIIPPSWTDHPWNNCVLTVGGDSCVALVSLETLRVERMFPGHPMYPSAVAWDGRKGYIACLCHDILSSYDSGSVLYLWDVKSGARDRIIRGTTSHSMFDQFCRTMNANSTTESTAGSCSSASSLLPFVDDLDMAPSHVSRNDKGKGKLPLPRVGHNSYPAQDSSKKNVPSLKVCRNIIHPVKSSCPFPGIATLVFDLSSLMSMHFAQSSDKQVKANFISHAVKEPCLQPEATDDNSTEGGSESHPIKDSAEESLLRFSLSFLHLWDVDKELDQLLMEEMDVCKPDGFYIASGLLGDRGCLTLAFPGLDATLELWKSSSEFCAMRSLAIVSLAQRMICLSHSSTTASSALAAFYTRNFAEKVPDIKPPLLQLLVSFWQDPSEHVRMAARSLFHCAAPRAIPRPLCGRKTIQLESSLNILEEHGPSDKGNCSVNVGMDLERSTEILGSAELEKSILVAWLESFEIHEWISWIGGANQDAMASHIIVAAALVVWYPSMVKDDLAKLVVSQLVKLVMSMNDGYSSTAAELLAEGMESTWKACLGSEIPHLITDIFFQIECLTGTAAHNSTENPALAINMREALIEILLPSLAMADIPGFLNVVESQIWATSSDSPVHQVSIRTVIRVVRGSPKPLAPYLDKAVNYILQTMDPGNLVMRKACLKSSMTVLREITRLFPMVGINESSTRLAVGDPIGDIRSVTIRVYDIESVTKIKVLDASDPLGLPSFIEGVSKTKMATSISALSFSPDGEGLVALSENGLMIRWWSLGIGWWEKLSRNLVPVQCTKLIFVPPWEGFSPNSSLSSIIASMFGNDKQLGSQDSPSEMDDVESLKMLIHNLDLSYRFQWVSGRNVVLTRHGQELGTFPL